MQELGLVIVIIVLGAILTAYGWYDAQPGRQNTFLNFENLIDGIATPMSYYAIMAVGMTLVIITAGIDISVASILAVAGLVTAWVLQHFPSHAPASVVLPLSILLPVGIGLLAGLINGALVVALRMHPFIVTLATLSIFRGIANVLPFGVKTLPLAGKPPPLMTATHLMRVNMFGLQLWPMILMLIVVIAGWIYLSFTVAGRENYAVGGNEEAAKYSGLRVGRIKLRVYALSGLCAGLAGLVSLGRFGTISTNTAFGYELTVVAAAVVGGASLSGGRGTALGALLGTLVLALIENGINILHLNQEYKNIIVGLAILIAVALDGLSEYLRNRQLAGAKVR